MEVAIVKYNAGNIYSVVNALRRLGIEPLITDEAEALQRADRVLFPGQGNALTTMDYLRGHHLDELIRDLRQPVLGICVGQQLLCSHSEEGDVDCIGIFPTEVRRFQPQRHEEKVPAIGWNALHKVSSPLFKNISEDDYVYFVHSYYAEICSFTVQTCTYIVPFSAALRKDNFYALQYHPEKSGSTGAVILEQFLKQ